MDFLQKYWDQFFGAILIIVGVIWIAKKEIPIGIEGRKPSFQLKGDIAILLGVIVCSFGLLFLIDWFNVSWSHR